MPSSHYHQLNEIVEAIVEFNPQALLDLGVGFGKYGFLAREYLELWDEVGDYHDWNRTIDGIEAFEPYIGSIQKAIYNEIFIGNALAILPTLQKRYDLILMIDVLEHFTYEEGLSILDLCKKVGKNILISVPLDMSAQEEVFGNPFETHKYPWGRKDFSKFTDVSFLPNRKSFICLVGEDAVNVGNRLRSRQNRQRWIDFLTSMHLKKPIKWMLGK